MVDGATADSAAAVVRERFCLSGQVFKDKGERRAACL